MVDTVQECRCEVEEIGTLVVHLAWLQELTMSKSASPSLPPPQGVLFDSTSKSKKAVVNPFYPIVSMVVYYRTTFHDVNEREDRVIKGKFQEFYQQSNQHTPILVLTYVGGDAGRGSEVCP